MTHKATRFTIEAYGIHTDYKWVVCHGYSVPLTKAQAQKRFQWCCDKQQSIKWRVREA